MKDVLAETFVRRVRESPYIAQLLANFAAVRPVFSVGQRERASILLNGAWQILIHFGDFAKFFRGCLDSGVYLPPSAYETAFLSTAHEGDAVNKACEVMSSVLRKL